MPGTGQDISQSFANLRLVVDDEDVAQARAFLTGGPGIDADRVHGANGQHNGKHGSSLDRTVDRERAAMGVNYAVTHRQSDARAYTRRLGSEIGLEDPRAKMLWNAGAVVLHRNPDLVGGRIETAGHP